MADDKKKEAEEGLKQLQENLPKLVKSLKENGNDVDALQQMETLCGRSNRANRLPMVTGGYGTFLALRHAMQAGVEAQTATCQVLRNLAVEEKGAIGICEEPGLTEMLHQVCLADMDSVDPSEPERTPEKKVALRDKALTVFFHLSDVEQNRHALLRLEHASAPKGIVETCCRPLLQEDNYKAQRALMFIAILRGREEGGDGELLTQVPELVQKVVNLLKNVLFDPQYEKKWGWKITHPLYPLRNLCIADNNKVMLATKENVLLLAQVLQDHKENKQACRLSIGTLLELSFRYEDDDPELTDTLFDAEVRTRLGPLLEDGSPEAEHVKHRMTPQEDHARPTDVEEVEGRHVMMSYSWNAHKDHVIEIARLLRAKGYEVWRDEEGSACCPPMGQGGVDEIMALAVEKAAIVAICVSKAYKESANCRMEGQYANREYKHGNTELVFIMMDDQYTTVSKQRVDGWLGIMIGDALWYPAWEFGQLTETVNRIAVKCEKKPELKSAKPPPPAPPPETPKTKAPSPTPASTSSQKVAPAKPEPAGFYPDPAQKKTTFSRTISTVGSSQDAPALQSTTFNRMKSMPAVRSEDHTPKAETPKPTHSSRLAKEKFVSDGGHSGGSGRESAMLPSKAEEPAHRVAPEAFHSAPTRHTIQPAAAVAFQEPEVRGFEEASISVDDDTEEVLQDEDVALITVDAVQQWLIIKRLEGFRRPFSRRKNCVDGRGLFMLRHIVLHEGFWVVQYLKDHCGVPPGEALSLFWELKRSSSIQLLEELLEALQQVPEGGMPDEPEDSSTGGNDELRRDRATSGEKDAERSDPRVTQALVQQLSASNGNLTGPKKLARLRDLLSVSLKACEEMLDIQGDSSAKGTSASVSEVTKSNAKQPEASQVVKTDIAQAEDSQVTKAVPAQVAQASQDSVKPNVAEGSSQTAAAPIWNGQQLPLKAMVSPAPHQLSAGMTSPSPPLATDLNGFKKIGAGMNPSMNPIMQPSISKDDQARNLSIETERLLMWSSNSPGKQPQRPFGRNFDNIASTFSSPGARPSLGFDGPIKAGGAGTSFPWSLRGREQQSFEQTRPFSAGHIGDFKPGVPPLKLARMQGAQVRSSSTGAVTRPDSALNGSAPSSPSWANILSRMQDTGWAVNVDSSPPIAGKVAVDQMQRPAYLSRMNGNRSAR